jgi:hypothetical protein
MSAPIFPLDVIASGHAPGLVAGVAAGFGFGFVLERAGFGNARKLVPQFYGTEMVMLKVMFTAIVTAVLGVAILSGLGLLDPRALGDTVSSGTFLWPMLLGGFLIGVGIMASGYCPGTSLVGIASGKLDALLAYLGVMIGQIAWAELEWRPAIARFHDSGSLGHVYLYDLLHVPLPILAAALVGVAVGAFLLGEYVERRLAGPGGAPAPGPRRYVWAGLAGAGALALVTLAVPTGSDALAGPPSRISPEALARRVLDEPWNVRVLDLRPPAACAAQRVPGAECTPPDTLKDLSLGDVAAARALVLVGEGTIERLPPEVLAYRGPVAVLEGGFPAWKAWALTAPEPPAAGATAAELEAFRLRAGISAALTGVKQAAPPPPSGGGAPVRRKAGGGGCSG